MLVTLHRCRGMSARKLAAKYLVFRYFGRVMWREFQGG